MPQPTKPVMIPDPNTIRAPIESQHNGIRDAREKKYVADRVALETAYHADLAQIQQDKQTALEGAGLNADGSTNPEYGWGAPPTLPEPGAI